MRVEHRAKRIAHAFVAVAFALVSALGLALMSDRASASEPLNVVATTGMIADAARMVGGNEVRVRALMGPGVDPHAYRQTRSDIIAMSRADLVLAHGLYLEAQMEEFLAKLKGRKPVVFVGEAVAREKRIAHADYPDKFDPHVWMMPALWTDVVAAVRDALAAARPSASAVFAANADRAIAEITELDRFVSERLATVPEQARVLVTAHDAFRYFGRAYGFEVLGIQGISTESEAGLKRISDLVDLIVARGIKAVFVETSVSDRNIRALIEGARARGHDVSVGGELFSDSMGAPGTPEGTYLGMIRHNAEIISAALGGRSTKNAVRF